MSAPVLPERPDEWDCIPFFTTDTRGRRVEVVPTAFVDYVFALWNYMNNLREAHNTGTKP